LRTYSIKLQKNKPTNFFIAGDWHSYHLHNASYERLKQQAMLVPKKERRLIINGDFFDAEDFYKKSDSYITRRKDPFGQELLLASYEDEMSWGNRILDELQEVFTEIYFVQGNHSIRYEHFRDSYCPDGLKHNYHIENSLSLAKRKIPYIFYRGWINIGDKTIVTHGEFHSPNSCHKKHYEVYGGKNVFFGHIHSYQVRSFSCKNQTRYSISCPAMCNLDAPYLEGAAQNWENGFIQVIFYKDTFQVYPHFIINNKHISTDVKIS